jgi:hypothetical protein
MSIHVFGIRHHGPGCARSLRSALEALVPDVLLVEGPPDAESVLPLLMHPEMKPPVALLVYPPDHPAAAVYFPFTEFSPEWQALRFGVETGIPVRFMDLPQAHQLALDLEARASLIATMEGEAEEKPEERVPSDAAGARAEGDGEAVPAGKSVNPAAPEADDEESSDPLFDDPIGVLSQAAGYGDRELWWEHQIEQRQDSTGLFAAIMDAMTSVREQASEPRVREAQREAFMRTTIRTAVKEGFQKIAVVCGAWHAPVLKEPGPAKPDQAVLKALPKIKVAATWVPWTNSRLSYRSGYGAGVASPGWYQHLWISRDQAAIRWVTEAARLLRSEDLDASSASVIEAVRTADSLAALRGLPMPGLAELNESILAVLCQGESSPMALIRERLEIGDAMGEVPKETPSVPLQKDLETKQKALRLKPTTEIKLLELDLRNESDLSRSRLLHQLSLLGIDWGVRKKVTGTTGTFKEAWQLQWQVEFPVHLIEANIWGNTVESAASARAKDLGRRARDLPPLSDLLDRVILAGLPEAIAELLLLVGSAAAVAADVSHLMDALPALSRVARYGDVRGTSAKDVLPVVDALFERVVIGLPNACTSIDDAVANGRVDSIGRVQESVDLLDRMEMTSEWRKVLQRLVDRSDVHGTVRGWSCRLLLEQKVIDEAELQRRARLALSPATPTSEAAAWAFGLMRGSGLVLLHQDGLWAALDEWLDALPPDGFTELLPLLRRAFSGFQPPERRSMGEKVRKLRTRAETAGHPGAVEPDAGLAELDRERADRVLPVLALILGVKSDGA